ncbi:hypothetical protein BDN72DRAFT_897220 [Pluteus cervinus]|uniref:Uncharacterized protein n=1 Tax=Pluteus cervinus TaxID=181527 RepID=A0ACD3AUM6_9AGAR|nr:hypothetical protein BDN72DRAFT_897220 [Pluteus cervinus]
MGQSNSRARNSPSSRSLPPTATPRPPIPVPSESSSSSTLPETSSLPVAEPPKRSRRARVRQSISNFVRPYTPHSFRARVDNTVNTSRQTWRNSKRFSKTPPDFHSTSDSSCTAGPSTHPPSPLVEKDEVDSETDLPPDFAPNQDLVNESTVPMSSSSMDVPSEALSEGSTHVDDGDGGAPDAAQAPADPAVPRIVTPSSASPSDSPLPDSAPSQPPTDPSSSSPAPSPLPPQTQRPFPSPGTLVVVQGVVHTTDVPRPNPPASTLSPQPPAPRPRSSSLPRTSTLGSERSNARNRLSALLRPRPSSVMSPRMSSLEDSTAPTPVSLLSQTEPSSEATDSPSLPAESPLNTPLSSDTSNTRPGAISSSSIEVLGTLLSVAAAATAASLLTGSSEPILSGGLAPPGSSGNGATSPATLSTGTDDVPTSRPTSPTPTAGLGDMAAASRAERLRQAWSSIRERLGLRPTPGPAPPNTTGQPPARDATTDTRELMLAEMARAFNLGLGLNPEGTTQTEGDSQREPSTSTPPPTSPNDRPSPPPLPAEGSFDRFLMDLQADLRVALTQGSRPSSTLASPVEPTNTGLNVPEQSSFENATAVTESSSPEALERNDHVEDEDRITHETSSGLEGETRHDEHEGYNVDDVSNSQHEDAATGAQPSSSNHTEQGDSEDGLSRINWWRLYRFPPVETARVYGSHLGNGPSNPNTRLPDTNSGSSLTTPPSSSPSAPSSSTETSSVPMASTVAPAETPSTSESATPLPQSESQTSTTTESSEAQPQAQQSQQYPSIVYPVIVVGLQSVNLNWRRDNNAPSTNNEAQPNEQQDNEEAIIDDAYEEDDLQGGESPIEDGGSRGRRWGSRAASAFRNLRPGATTRRNATSAPSSPVGTPGSRTFLIYVIGGYYPPDHSIVTGGPNNLDTFEALLELAELLGQVKPPTVTKDEIDKSGLEIIKPVQLQEYEQNGRIASNCTERCLICLDDYDPEDDVRVMSCRHAFHKSCVDTWLQTGKNNCPACRSRGVSNEPALAEEVTSASS